MSPNKLNLKKLRLILKKPVLQLPKPILEKPPVPRFNLRTLA